jgi:hypothetical protein
LLYLSRISRILLKRYHDQQTSQKTQSQLRELLDPDKKKKIRSRETKKIQRRRRWKETDLLARTWKSLTLIATDQLEAVEKKIRKITNPAPHTYRYTDLSLNATEEPHEEVCSFGHRNKTQTILLPPPLGMKLLLGVCRDDETQHHDTKKLKLTL